MKPIYQTLKRTLSAKTVDEISEFAASFFLSVGMEKKNIARYRLSVEELLLAFLEQKGEGIDVTVSTYQRFFKPYFSISVAGKAFDPFRSRENAIGSYSSSLLKTIGLSPDYSYQNEENVFTFKVRKKRLNPLITLLITLAAAFAVGFAGFLLPESIRIGILNQFLTPLHDTFLNLLGCAAGPMIFLSVSWGIYGIGDTTTLGRIGKKMILGLLFSLYVSLVAIGLLILPFFSLSFSSGSSGGSGIKSIFELILGIIPENIFTPFINGNSLQIIFLAFLIGIAMLFLGKRTAAVAKAVEQINYIVQFLMEFVGLLVPYFIFIVLVRFIWSDTLQAMGSVAKFFAVLVGAILVMTFCHILFISVKFRVNPLTLVKKGLPTLMIAISTASSAAAFGSNMNACEKKYGIERSVTSFGIPLGMVMFKPSTAISYFLYAVFFAEYYGLECSISWIVIAFFISGILSVATPPIPGGALTAYTIIFLQLGIPAEALAITLAIDAVVDFITTGFDQFLLPFSLINRASGIGRLDLDILRKN